MKTEWEYGIFQYINQLAMKESFINLAMIFLAKYAVYIFCMGLLVYWFTRIERNRHMVLQTVISAFTALAVSKVISHFLYRARPFVDHDVIQLISHEANASFPSNHATGTFVIATMIWLFRKRDGWGWLILASLVSFSRIWVGVHYPLDILGGMINGIFCAVIIHSICTRWTWTSLVLNRLLRFYEYVEQQIWINREQRPLPKKAEHHEH